MEIKFYLGSLQRMACGYLVFSTFIAHLIELTTH